MSTDKPFSQSCENNKGPILEILQQRFADRRRVLEIGSGTGQHAVHFARHLPHLTWQTSDLPANHNAIKLWLAEAGLDNLLPPLTLSADDESWQVDRYDALFSANTLHIMGWPQVEKLFGHLAGALLPGGVLAVYGPFNYGGEYTSPSNARFDDWLQTQSPVSRIRDFEQVDALARGQGIHLLQDYAMPANNRLIVWQA